MDHDAAQSDHSDNESKSDCGIDEDPVLNSAKIDAILACLLCISADSAANAVNALSSIWPLSGEIVAFLLYNQSLGDQLAAIVTEIVALRASPATLHQNPPPAPAQTYADAAWSASANPPTNRPKPGNPRSRPLLSPNLPSPVPNDNWTYSSQKEPTFRLSNPGADSTSDSSS